MNQYEYYKIKIRGENYLFEKSLITEDFIKEFKNNFNLVRNYQTIKKIFNDDESCEVFAIYDKFIITDEFVKAFKPGMHNYWDSYHLQAFDPAICPRFTGSLATENAVSNIQKTLATICKLRGEEGLNKLRGLNFAQCMFTDFAHFLNIESSCNNYSELDNIYNIVDCDGCLTLTNDDFDLVKISIEAIDSSAFSKFPNENVKGNLFCFPHLWHDLEGNPLSDDEIDTLLHQIENQMSNHTPTLDIQAYNEASFIVHHNYLATNLEKYIKFKVKVK